MKRISKLLCLTICIIMLLTTALTGCDGTTSTKGNSTSGKPISTDTTAADAEPPPEPYEVVWYIPGNGTEPDEKLIEQEINKYLKDKINTTVDIVMLNMWGEYDQKVQTIIQSGEKADLFFSCSWLTIYTDIVRKGMATEITDEMLDKYAPHASDVLKGAFLDGTKVDGERYFLPCNKEIGAQGGVLLNKAFVDKYNFDYSKVKTFKDLAPMLQTIKENEPGVYPLDICAGCTIGPIVNCMANWMDPPYINFPANGTKWVSTFDVPEIVDVFRVTKEYFDAGYMRKDAAIVSDVMPDQKAGKVFATVMQLKPGKDKEYNSATPGVEWIQVGLTDNVIRSGDVTGSMMAIPKTCPKPERVLEFYDYFYHDKELLTLMNYGIESMHYVKVDEKTVDYAPATENGTKSGWKPPYTIWMVGDQFGNYILKGEDPQKYEALTKFNADCKPFKDTMGFLFDKTKCQNTFDSLKSTGQDLYTLLMVGAAGDVDAAMAEQTKLWNDAGFQDVLAEYNKQFEAWKASK